MFPAAFERQEQVRHHALAPRVRMIRTRAFSAIRLTLRLLDGMAAWAKDSLVAELALTEPTGPLAALGPPGLPAPPGSPVLLISG